MLKQLFKTILAGVMAVFILSLFCFFYLNDGINISNPTRATDYTNLPGSVKATLEEGWCFFRMDKNGYNNITVSDKVDILLMGSSHVESAHMQPEYSINSYMNRMLEDLYTYNIGVPGHTIYRCADNMESAIACYAPQKYVIVETSTVSLDMEQMLSVIERKAEAIPTHDSGVLYYLQRIPAIKDFFNKISLWWSVSHADKSESNSSEKHVKSDDDYQLVLNRFLRKMKGSIPENCELIIFYHPNAKLGSDGNFNYERESNMRRVFREQSEQNDIIFLDMTNDFQEAYEKENVLAHGFANTAVGKGHINRVGNRLVAEKIVRVITGIDNEY